MTPNPDNFKKWIILGAQTIYRTAKGNSFSGKGLVYNN